MSGVAEDWRLTAYALGELDPEDRAEMAARLRDDPEATAEVEAIRGAYALATRQLRPSVEAPPHP